jgi:hypothetical protein
MDAVVLLLFLVGVGVVEAAATVLLEVDFFPELAAGVGVVAETVVLAVFGDGVGVTGTVE